LEAELEALGDELELDADTSYLDDAMKDAPGIPTRAPTVFPFKLLIQSYFLGCKTWSRSCCS
jgi:hypothetical protein